MPRAESPRVRPGRPPKYGRPARAVTLRLPEDTLARLAAIDVDLGRAIMSIVADRAPEAGPLPPAEQVAYGRHSVIVVSPVPALRRLDGVQLVPVARGRALIALRPSHSVSDFELQLRDAVERGELTEQERVTFEAIATILRRSRRSKRIIPTERTIIVLEPKRWRRHK